MSIVISVTDAASQTNAAWLVLTVAGISAVGAIIAAVIAAVSAARSRRSDLEAQRTRDLEARVGEKKYGVYEPMINQLGAILTPGAAAAMEGNNEAQERLKDTVASFTTWISIYGSDEAVTRFQRFICKPPPRRPAGCSAQMLRRAHPGRAT